MGRMRNRPARRANPPHSALGCRRASRRATARPCGVRAARTGSAAEIGPVVGGPLGQGAPGPARYGRGGAGPVGGGEGVAPVVEQHLHDRLGDELRGLGAEFVGGDLDQRDVPAEGGADRGDLLGAGQGLGAGDRDGLADVVVGQQGFGGGLGDVVLVDRGLGRGQVGRADRGARADLPRPGEQVVGEGAGPQDRPRVGAVVTADSTAVWCNWLAEPWSRGISIAAASEDSTVKRCTPAATAASTKASTPCAGKTKARSTPSNTCGPSVAASARSPATTSTPSGRLASSGLRVSAADGGAAREEGGDEVAADGAGRAGDEDGHCFAHCLWWRLLMASSSGPIRSYSVHNSRRGSRDGEVGHRARAATARAPAGPQVMARR